MDPRTCTAGACDTEGCRTVYDEKETKRLPKIMYTIGRDTKNAIEDIKNQMKTDSEQMLHGGPVNDKIDDFIKIVSGFLGHRYQGALYNYEDDSLIFRQRLYQQQMAILADAISNEKRIAECKHPETEKSEYMFGKHYTGGSRPQNPRIYDGEREEYRPYGSEGSRREPSLAFVSGVMAAAAKVSIKTEKEITANDIIEYSEGTIRTLFAELTAIKITQSIIQTGGLRHTPSKMHMLQKKESELVDLLANVYVVQRGTSREMRKQSSIKTNEAVELGLSLSGLGFIPSVNVFDTV